MCLSFCQLLACLLLTRVRHLGLQPLTTPPCRNHFIPVHIYNTTSCALCQVGLIALRSAPHAKGPYTMALGVIVQLRTSYLEACDRHATYQTSRVIHSYDMSIVRRNATFKSIQREMILPERSSQYIEGFLPLGCKSLKGTGSSPLNQEFRYLLPLY